jgi:hypothetical protein
MFTTSARRLARAVGGLALAAAALASSGCYSEGGLGWSEDQYVYVSRPYQPWTVALRDTRTGQIFWTIDVPVGQQLVIDFVEGGGTPGSFTPDTMNWDLMPAGEEYKNLSSAVPVPPADSRRLDPSLRAVPEFPRSMIKANVQPPNIDPPPAPPAPEPTIPEPVPAQPADPTAPPIDLPPR